MFTKYSYLLQNLDVIVKNLKSSETIKRARQLDGTLSYEEVKEDFLYEMCLVRQPAASVVSTASDPSEGAEACLKPEILSTISTAEMQ